MSQNTLQKKNIFNGLVVKSWWFVMFVMVFVVETIRIFFVMVLLFFSAGESEPHQTKKINICIWFGPKQVN